MKIFPLQHKVVGELLLLVPVIFLMSFGMGEMSSGMVGGIQHFVQLFLLLILAVMCWFYPKIGGGILMGLSLLLALFYVFSFQEVLLGTRLLISLLLFGLPTLSGVLFSLSAQRKK